MPDARARAPGQRRAAAGVRPWRLYWACTDDGHEDWFVVARDASGAARFHERAEGYDPGDARATLVGSLPPALPVRGPKYPGSDLLVACGAEILRAETPMVVKLHGRHFVEGGLQHVLDTAMDDLFEERGDGRVNRTRRQGRPS